MPEAFRLDSELTKDLHLRRLRQANLRALRLAWQEQRSPLSKAIVARRPAMALGHWRPEPRQRDFLPGSGQLWLNPLSRARVVPLQATVVGRKHNHEERSGAYPILAGGMLRHRVH